MRIIKADAYIMDDIDAEHIMRKLEACGRVCYKSEDKTTPDSAEAFVGRLIASGHESVLEHVSITAKFICDRGVSHEVVRHRIASYSQESTRYANYSDERFNSEIAVIEPCMLSGERYLMWRRACEDAERTYMGMLTAGCTAQEARSVLPNSLKTELIMTANLREWRHFFKLRCAAASHPQMREVANILLKEMQERLPVVFGGGCNMTDKVKAALQAQLAQQQPNEPLTLIPEMVDQLAAKDAEIARLTKALHKADIDCDHCKHNHGDECENADFDCMTCDCDCICKSRRDNSNWEWRGAEEG